nr:AlNc14C436G11625 [Albugo laibachii Nc14]|eukprot:CCA26959.1 AlNc14C436G11625 [Albugo laibachii Nc14]
MQIPSQHSPINPGKSIEDSSLHQAEVFVVWQSIPTVWQSKPTADSIKVLN